MLLKLLFIICQHYKLPIVFGSPIRWFYAIIRIKMVWLAYLQVEKAKAFKKIYYAWAISITNDWKDDKSKFHQRQEIHVVEYLMRVIMKYGIANHLDTHWNNQC